MVMSIFRYLCIYCTFFLSFLGFVFPVLAQQYGVGDVLSGVFIASDEAVVVISDCVSQETQRDSCYVKLCEYEPGYLCAERLLDVAVASIGPEKAMMVLHDIVQSPLFAIQTDGHLLAHIIGQSLSKYFGSSGENFLRCPHDFNDGCYHGFFEDTLAKVDDPVVVATAICESMPPESTSDKEKSYCYHGAGHVFLMNESQAEGAIEFCSYSIDSSFEETCYDRLIVQMSEVIPSDVVWQFCEKLPGKYRDQCTAQETPRAIPLSSGLGGFDSLVFPKKVDNAIIQYVNGMYVPDVVHVSVGQKVVWVNESDELFWPASNLHPTHTAYPGSGIEKCGTSEKFDIFDACEALGVDGKYSFVFDKEGQWRYHDHINPRATGTVTVSK